VLPQKGQQGTRKADVTAAMRQDENQDLTAEKSGTALGDFERVPAQHVVAVRPRLTGATVLIKTPAN
jgi:hypothetical protein